MKRLPLFRFNYRFCLGTGFNNNRTRLIKWRMIFWAALIILFIFTVTPRGYAKAQGDVFPHEETFVISSYYSPLPGQSRYATGSYESDVRLNGEGVHAADGSKVYPGMIAAPPHIPFGTKMEIPGVGIVAVHDRGGAIKNNRLDIWVGYGEEGLSRALAWGLKTLKVTVHGVDEQIAEKVDLDSLPKADLNRLPIASLVSIQPSFSLGLGDTSDQVAALQKALKKLGYFKNEETGYFGEETAGAILNLQRDGGIIESSDDVGAGIFGQRTQAYLTVSINARRSSEIALVPTAMLSRGSSGEEVEQLQMLLHSAGFLPSVSKVFDAATEEALKRFQVDMGVIQTNADRGAGVFGPKSQQALRDLVAARWEDIDEIKNAAKLAYFSQDLNPNDASREVTQLQEVLEDLNFLGRGSTGYYGKTTEHAIAKFQQAFGIIDDVTATGAGVVGPKTREVLNGIIEKRTEVQRAIAQTSTQQKIVAARIEDEAALLARIFASYDIPSGLTFGSRGPHVEALQQILRRLGFFPGRVTTEYFGAITERSVSAFQKSHGLPSSGKLDPTTVAILKRITTGA